jgi:hypothetical protein
MVLIGLCAFFYLPTQNRLFTFFYLFFFEFHYMYSFEGMKGKTITVLLSRETKQKEYSEYVQSVYLHFYIKTVYTMGLYSSLCSTWRFMLL